MSNYDFNDRWTPYDAEKWAKDISFKLCPKDEEHGEHRFSEGEYDPAWHEFKGPWFKCPGVGPRTMVLKEDSLFRYGMIELDLHDDGTVTWRPYKGVSLPERREL